MIEDRQDTFRDNHSNTCYKNPSRHLLGGYMYTKNDIMKRAFFFLSISFLFCWNPDSASAQHLAFNKDQQQDSCEEHVRFLGRPELNGRSPMSGGSLRARQHIVEVFQRLGLQPWKEERSFTQSIRFGANVVGVLPGNDPQLAGQIILISAHYDHLGNGKLGAADDASGVGALLEIASRFTHATEGPKRTLCFAVFDCEEMGLFGSTAFTCRKDFNAADIAAVVNLDILGRRGFDCMDNSLFLGKTHASPPLYGTADQAAQNAGLRLLTYHALLVGPRADHVPFAALGIPALFFSTGPFKDYHTKEDTIQNMNWELLRRSCNTVYDTVRWLAETPTPIFDAKESLGSKEDLQVLRQIINALPETDRATQEKRAVAEKAIDEALGAARFNRSMAYNILPEVTLAIGPQMDLLTGASLKSYTDTENAEYFYRNFVQLLFFEKHAADIMEMYRQSARHFLENGSIQRTDPVQEPEPYYFVTHGKRHRADFEVCRNPLQKEEISIVPLNEGQYHLGVLIPVIRTQLWQKPIGPPKVSIDLGWVPYACRGDIDTLIDYCFLMWKSPKWPIQNYIKPVTTDWDLAWRQVLEHIAPDMPKFDSMKSAFNYRIQKAGDKDENQWKKSVLSRKNPDILRTVYSLGYDRWDNFSRDILLDRTMPSDLRAGNLSEYFIKDMKEGGIRFTKQMIQDLNALTSDQTPILTALDTTPDLPPSMELAISISKVRSLSKETEKYSKQTIGEAAQKRLSEIAVYFGRQDLSEYSEDIYVPAGITLSCFPSGTMTIVRNRSKKQLWQCKMEGVYGYRVWDFITSY